MFERILVICTGNICRSPMAEALLRQQLQQAGRKVEVRSAGVGALVNAQADPPARERMLARGLDIEAHRAQQFNTELGRWADLILVMEKSHREAVADIDPTARGKTYLLGHWNGGKDIPDPYKRADAVYTQALAMIDAALPDWIRKL
jgi:protein-tyrosine phosphatase